MSEDLRGFYAEQDQVYYDLLDGSIFRAVKAASESNDSPGLNVEGVIAAIPQPDRGCPSLVRLSLDYMVKDGFMSAVDGIYRVVEGKTLPHWDGL